MQHYHNAVRSSLMHHWGCSGVRAGGLRSTHDTNAARKYCKTVPYACGCTLGVAPALSGDAPQHYRNGGCSSLVHHGGCSGVRTGGLTSTSDSYTAGKYCQTVTYACGCTLGFPLLLGGDAPLHYHNAVRSSLMHHHGCSGVRTGGLTSTHFTTQLGSIAKPRHMLVGALWPSHCFLQ
jgi:hypothetical protein